MSADDRVKASEATGHDEKLHQANRAAHAVARAALVFRNLGNPELFAKDIDEWARLGNENSLREAKLLREHDDALDEYERLMEGIVDTSPLTRRDMEVADRMIEEYERLMADE